MRHITVTLLALAIFSLYSSPTHAGDNDVGEVQTLCNDVNMGDWGSEEKMLKKVETMGFKPIRIKVEKGCWQVDALSRDKQKVEIYIHPASGKTVMRKFKESHLPLLSP